MQDFRSILQATPQSLDSSHLSGKDVGLPLDQLLLKGVKGTFWLKVPTILRPANSYAVAMFNHRLQWVFWIFLSSHVETFKNW